MCHFNYGGLVFSVLDPARVVSVPALLGPWWCVLEQDSWFSLCLHPPRTINGCWGIKYWEGTLWENWQPIKGEQQKAPSPFKSSLRASSLFGSHARFILGEIYFGREPREDWGGGELGRACRHDWRIFIFFFAWAKPNPIGWKWHASINFRGKLKLSWRMQKCAKSRSWRWERVKIMSELTSGEEEMLFFPQ